MGKQLKLFNTATRTVEPFVPLHDPVAIYACGPTVYNFAHIGNLRTYVFEDVLKRTLLSLGYQVKHVVNITDVGHLVSDADTGEDKMEKGAAREGKSVWEIAQFYTDAFMKNIKALDIKDPSLWTKATDYIPQMIDLVKTLEDKGFTYTTSDGIYFDTSKFPSYCDFARLDPSSLRAGERVDMGEKRNVTDFALWKFSPKDQKRQMEWESPWGVGFPGWHIECSAMSLANLPQPLDIHCGGMDHIRVHHTNEIAQTEAATGNQFARFWLHGEFLVMDKAKMSKSGEGFITLDSIIKEGIDPLAYRMFLYTAHYRSPLTFSWDGLRSAAQGLTNLRKAVALLPGQEPSAKSMSVETILDKFYDYVYDDLNMPRAVAAIWDIVHDTSISGKSRYDAISVADEILGLDLLSKKIKAEQEVILEKDTVKAKLVFVNQLPQHLQEMVIQKLVERKLARKNKDFSRADSLRKELIDAGWQIKDLPDGSFECRHSNY